MWDKRARVVRVVDGDTLEVMLDQGFGDTKTIDLRLKGVWAPEISKKQPGAVETKTFVAAWLGERDTGASWPYVVITDRLKDDSDEVRTFKRYVGTVKAGSDVLNPAINAFVEERGYPRGTGSA